MITLADVDEFINDGDQNTEIIISVDPTSDSNFVGLSNQSVFVITENNDFSGIDFISIDNLTDENGDTGSFGIKLKNEPIEPVKLFISSTRTDEGTVQEFIEFNSSNWDDYQVIVVTGIDDNPPISDGAQNYKIIFDSISSLDLGYQNLDLNQYEGIDFINQDNKSKYFVKRRLFSVEELNYNNFFIIDEILKSGNIPPKSYLYDKIKSSIINQRKLNLLKSINKEINSALKR